MYNNINNRTIQSYSKANSRVQTYDPKPRPLRNFSALQKMQCPPKRTDALPGTQAEVDGQPRYCLRI